MKDESDLLARINLLFTLSDRAYGSFIFNNEWHRPNIAPTR